MNKLICFIVGVLSFNIISCGGGSRSHVELSVGKPSNVITVTQDTHLTRDYKDTQFLVQHGVTLYASIFTIDGRNLGNTISFTPVVLIGSGKISKGLIQYGRGGVSAAPKGLPKDWQEVLTALPQYKRLAYVEKIRALAVSSPSIVGTRFYQNRVAIYLKSFTHRATVSDAIIERGRLGIYHDAGSTYAHVSGVTFKDIGVGYYSSKNTGGYFTYKSSRENVAIDASSFNVYENNNFLNGAKNAINLYVNCGEKNPQGLAVPREEPAVGNRITGNYFERFDTAIHIRSRALNRRTYPCRADEKGDRVFDTVTKSNIFKSVGVEVRKSDLPSPASY